MNPPTPGLRPLFNRTKQPAKVELVIPPGAEICVTDEVAAQLPVGQFSPVGDTSKEDAAAARLEAAIAAEAGDAADGVVEAADATPSPGKPAAKRASKRA